jgi:glycosyltransferase 2 family protein
VEGVDVRPGAEQPVVGSGERRVSRGRAIAGAVVIVVVVVAAAVAVYREWHSFADTLRRVGAGSMILSLLAGLVGVAATFPMWREVLHGLGVTMPWGTGSRIFFTSQLGKYLPGSVWPVVMQMEAGRARGASRRTMLAANLITLVMSCTLGLIVACVLLPLYDAHALRKYWWALLALPFLVALLHPRAMPALLDRAFALIGRAPLGERLDVSSELRAAGWSLLSWLGLGAHLAVLCVALGHGGISTFLLATGGMALAFSLGVLFIPAPAGAGVRDVVLTLVLRTMFSSGQALAVVVASRVILIVCDLVLAAVAAAARTRSRPVDGSGRHRAG